MAQVEIVRSLFQEVKNPNRSRAAGYKTHFSGIKTKFKGEAHEIIDLLESLETSPYKGKLLGSVGGIVIKELKYSGFRFYFITDGFKIKCLDEEKLVDLLLRFVRRSDKNHQQQTINEIKHILRTMGAGGFR